MFDFKAIITVHYTNLHQPMTKTRNHNIIKFFNVSDRMFFLKSLISKSSHNKVIRAEDLVTFIATKGALRNKVYFPTESHSVMQRSGMKESIATI